MNRSIKTIILMSIFMLITTGALFAQNKATIESITGKVEVFLNDTWVKATVGMEVPTNTSIATGFKSTATINLGDSTLLVRQLSRLQIEELSKTEGNAKTTLYLATGKVKADVRSSAQLKHDFQFKSPIATASVRGTSFEFSPTEIAVLSGAVSSSNSYGQTQLVVSGQVVTPNPETGVTDSTEAAFGTTTQTTQQPVIESETNEIPTVGAAGPTGNVNITVTYE